MPGVYDFLGSLAHKSFGLLRPFFLGPYVISFVLHKTFGVLCSRATGASFMDETKALDRK